MIRILSPPTVLSNGFRLSHLQTVMVLAIFVRPYAKCTAPRVCPARIYIQNETIRLFVMHVPLRFLLPVTFCARTDPTAEYVAKTNVDLCKNSVLSQKTVGTGHVAGGFGRRRCHDEPTRLSRRFLLSTLYTYENTSCSLFAQRDFATWLFFFKRIFTRIANDSDRDRLHASARA